MMVRNFCNRYTLVFLPCSGRTTLVPSELTVIWVQTNLVQTNAAELAELATIPTFRNAKWLLIVYHSAWCDYI